MISNLGGRRTLRQFEEGGSAAPLSATRLGRSSCQISTARSRSRSSAFTLIEIMIVVAIMAVIMGISIPFAWHALHRDAYNQTMADLVALFSNARAQAILQGSMAEVIVHKEDFQLSGVAAATGPNTKVTSSETTMAQSSHSGRSAHLSENVGIAALKINGVSFMNKEEGRIRFYPNGTCDELVLVIVSLENREMRGINLEVTTSLATIESDPNKLLKMVD